MHGQGISVKRQPPQRVSRQLSCMCNCQQEVEPCYGQAGRELARALLEGLLNVGEGVGDGDEQNTFPYLVVGYLAVDLNTLFKLFSITMALSVDHLKQFTQAVQGSHDSVGVRCCRGCMHCVSRTSVSACQQRTHASTFAAWHPT